MSRLGHHAKPAGGILGDFTRAHSAVETATHSYDTWRVSLIIFIAAPVVHGMQVGHVNQAQTGCWHAPGPPGVTKSSSGIS